ncbi:MAG TPA: thiamine phosphate synthase [Bryobacteraceae bacterium]|nr:thiamine phosphate synthase [Bryobacteraceae bacterium]
MGSFIRLAKLPKVYPILDTGTLERHGLGPVEAAEALLEGGAEILQYRHKAFWSGEAFARAGQIAELCREARVLFIVNDRADYARLLAKQDSGLHLGQEDLLPTDARTVIGPAPVIGFSTHNIAQMEAANRNPIADAIDYVAYGPVFGTSTKENPDPTTGLEALGKIRTLTAQPLVAIGGITRENAPHCWRAGADSVALIADLFPNPCTKRLLRERMSEWHQLSR